MGDKIIYVLLTTLMFLSFGCSDKQSANNKVFTFDNQIETSGLYGEWSISSTIHRTIESESEVLCNACPTMDFGNNAAVLTYPDSRTEHYTWKISADTLTLLSTNAQTVSTLPEFFHLKYKMEFKQEKEFIELKLSPDKSSTYVLRR